MAVDASGVTVTSSESNLITGFDVDIKHDNGLLYSSSGRADQSRNGHIAGHIFGR